MTYDDATPPRRVIDIAEPAAEDPVPPTPRPDRPVVHPSAMLHWPPFTVPASGTPGTDDRGLLARLVFRRSERSR